LQQSARGHSHGPKLLAAHPEQQALLPCTGSGGHDHRDLEGLKKAQQHNAGQDPSEAGTSGLQQVSRAGSDARGDGALLFVHPGPQPRKAPRDNAKQAQTCQGSKQHRQRTNQLARHGLKKRFGGAQCPDCRQQADAEQAFERGDRRASVVPSQCKRLLRLLPAAVQKSQVANIIPSEISLPLKTTMSSRMRTIWPMTALNPISASAALTAEAGCSAHGIVTGCIGAATRTRLEFSCAKAKSSKQYAVD
jgi:hypothetical protein